MTGRTGGRTLAGGLVAASMMGCIPGTLPPLELYRLMPADSAVIARRLGSVGGAPAVKGTVAVEPYATPGLYGEPQIVYRLGEARYGTYPSREWAIPLSSMLATRTAEALRAASFASGSVTTEPSRRGAHEFVWRGGVRPFEEGNRNRQVLAEVTPEP